ncbi:MAG: 1-acyl-sn-glycerol-3-phosphate acyltransferase [Lachnospiraceae bacterium]|nr:1-acyl-sn-glycerol-3-phosphate acyltransferase [Lachnospiraceae bacterium]
MGYLRAILVILFLAFFFLFGLLVRLYIFLTKRKDELASWRAYYAYVQWGFKCVAFLSGSKVTLIGTEKVPTDRAFLYVPNHRSIYDLILLAAHTPCAFAPISKMSLKKVPFLSKWMELIHSIFLDREDVQKGAEMVKEAVDLIKTGHSVLIFPEGTRSKVEGEMGPFHGGSFKIAIRADAPVVPVTIVNTGNIFEPHAPSIHSAHVIIEFGDPIETKGMSVAERKALPDTVKEWIAQTYEKDKELI